MSKLYNKAFKFGFLCSVLLFVILNIVSCVISMGKYNSEVHLADASGYSWGFPFEMYRNYVGYPYSEIGFTLGGVIINAFIIAGCGFFVGLFFRFISSKLLSRRSPLK